MTDKRFPKKEFIILSVGEAICVLVTILSFLGVSLSGIFDFEFSYKVITGAFLGAVVILLNFLFLSMSVNRAVDEYMALRGDKEMTDEEAEVFAQKNSALLQNAIKKSFIVRVVTIVLTLVVAFLIDWFNPLATVVPILAYQPILTWGNYLVESIKRVIVRLEKEKNSTPDPAEDLSTDDISPLDESECNDISTDEDECNDASSDENNENTEGSEVNEL